jgi:hypothetical protein
VTAPPLKTDPKYGYFPRWPENGSGWIHPADVALARKLIPSERVFRRNGTDGKYMRLYYGALTLRVLPALWQEVSPEGFEIGDWVEVLGRGMRNEPRTGIIREMLWDEEGRGIRYLIMVNEMPVAERYTRDDIRHIEPVTDRIEPTAGEEM